MNKLIRWFNIVDSNNNRFLTEIGAYVNGVMLDIGCGYKQEALKEKVRSYIGLEYPPARKVNERLSHTDADIFGDALYLPFKNGAFDSVIALSLLEHLRSPQRAAEESYRVLKKGGVFCLTVPFLQKLHTQPYDFFRFTIYGIRHIVESAGFTIVKTSNGGGMWKVFGARLAGYLYSDILGLGYGPDDRSVKPKIYLLPVLFPLIFIIVLLSRILDKLHYVPKDSLGYCLVCRK